MNIIWCRKGKKQNQSNSIIYICIDIKAVKIVKNYKKAGKTGIHNIHYAPFPIQKYVQTALFCQKTGKGQI